MASLYVVPKEYEPKTKEFMRLIARSINVERQDLAALFLLGDSFNTYILARELLLKDGLILDSSEPVLPGMELKGIKKIANYKTHPALRIATEAHQQVTKLLIEFNLTPKSRKKPEPVASNETPEIEPIPAIEQFIPKLKKA